MQLARLDGQDDLLRLAVAVVEVDPAVDSLVRALLLLDGPRTDQAERPPLELIRVARRELRASGSDTGSPITSYVGCCRRTCPSAECGSA